MKLDDLYALCAREGIETHSVKCPESVAISLEMDGTRYIGMDRSVFKNESRERVVLAHELGHALTGAYYENLENPVNIKRMEHRATKKTVEMLIPKDELCALLSEDMTLWDICEHFDVPYDLAKKAVWIYFKKEAC